MGIIPALAFLLPRNEPINGGKLPAHPVTVHTPVPRMDSLDMVVIRDKLGELLGEGALEFTRARLSPSSSAVEGGPQGR